MSSTISRDTFNRIQNLYSQLLVADNKTKSSIGCSIVIGKITGILNKNCIINIQNICSKAGNNLLLLDVATSTILGLLDNAVSNQLMTVYNSLRQDCISQASVLQNITVQDLDLGICNSKFPVEFNFVNSGEAISNCLNNSLMRLTQEVTIVPENDTLKMLQDNYQTIAGLGIGITIIVLLLILAKRKQYTIIWRKT